LISADQEYLSNILWQGFPAGGRWGYSSRIPGCIIQKSPPKRHYDAKVLVLSKKNPGQKMPKSGKIEIPTIYNKMKYMKMLKVLNPQNKAERPVKLIITENQFKSLISNLNEQPLKQLKK
jgi:hypothetical protein